MAEFAARFGFFPRPDFPWPLYVLGVRMTPRFSARHRLEVGRGVGDGVGAIFGAGFETELKEDELIRAAYPTVSDEPAFMVRQKPRES